MSVGLKRGVVKENMGTEGESEGGLVLMVDRMMQTLWEDRRRQEEKLAEERWLWDEERRRRELELEEERCEKSARHEEQTFEQMRVQRALVEGVQFQGEAMKKQADSVKDVMVAKLTKQDDIVSYLTTFEKLMIAFEVKREMSNLLLYS